MNEIYLLRHSEPLKVNNIENSDSLQLQNEKWVLTINGENIAKEKSKNSELQNFDIVFSSNYVRAISTAKYLAEKNHLDININDNFGERKFGINDWKEKPKDFELNQFYDESYKIGNGESQKEVRDRFYRELLKILEENKNKKIAIISHATAIRFLLMKWCVLKEDGFYYNDKKIIDINKCDYCECFKLEFDDNNELINIQNIK